MNIKVWHVLLTLFVLFSIGVYLLIQPYAFWFIALKQPFTLGHINKYYIYSANTSVFKFQKEFTYDWIAGDATHVVKDYDVALKYIDKLDKLNIKMYRDINIIRKFDVYMALKDYEDALKVAKINKKFQNKFEMEIYCAIGDYKNAKEAYNKYWEEYIAKYPKYNNRPIKYYYLARVEYSGKKYENAHKEINEYFKKDNNSKYRAAWELRADIAKMRNDKKDYEFSSQKVKEINKNIELQIHKENEQIYKDINNAFRAVFYNKGR